jgi:SAM-dependent methyltransferase
MIRGLFKRAEPRSAPKPAPTVPADEILERLLPRDQLIDRFDATYLDDLPVILKELHGVDPAAPRTSDIWPDLARLWNLSGRDADDFELGELATGLVEGAGVSPARYTPLHNTPQDQKRFKYTRVKNWREAAGVRIARGNRDSDAIGVVNRLQSGYSHDVQGGKVEVAFDALARPETGDPWSDLIRDLVAQGIIRADEPHLTIGPRWVGEIHYFRTQLGLPHTIGLDLFTHDEELVKVGDMHDMPFEDDSFGLVYQRNTFDKSYDIRTALAECVRVLRDGGVLISDDCYDYVQGVSEMARTNVKHNEQLLRALGDHAGKVLYSAETRAEDDWIERLGQLAVVVRKS